ncbi:MAG: hypothetical protein WD467_03505 [Candidatus Saccharimonadales bacterium]
MNSNDTKQAITNIVNTPMDRKQFLTYVGAGAVAVSGINAGLKLFSGNKRGIGTVTSGYGGSAYGA